MLKKAIFGLFLSLLLVFPALAQTPEPELIRVESAPEESTSVNLYFFWGDGCPHCANEKIFLNELVKTYPEVVIRDYEVWGSSKNRAVMKSVGDFMNANVTGVPFTVIGDRYWIGWQNSYANEFIETIEGIKAGEISEPVKELLGGSTKESEPEPAQQDEERVSKAIELPIFGEINSADFSLPLLTIIIGALDGFNPCAMWTLIFLIGLLVNMKNKRRMWILGTAFIVTSAAFYFGVLAAWLNLLLFIGFIVWVRWIIAAVALGGGIINLKEFWFNKDAVCKIDNSEKRKETMEKLKAVTQRKQFWMALSGIIVLAIAVNMVELVCSAGLPAVYTQVLALSNIPTWQYYTYILLYILFFMLDDLIVFFVAMKTLQITGVTTKYTRISQLIGGLAMVVIGLLLFFRPEWLMFG